MSTATVEKDDKGKKVRTVETQDDVHSIEITQDAKGSFKYVGKMYFQEAKDAKETVKACTDMINYARQQNEGPRSAFRIAAKKDSQ